FRCVDRPADSSSLSLPAALLVGLPVGRLEAIGLGLAPAFAGRRNRVGILAVEDQHDALIVAGILRHRRAVEQEAYRGAVWIVVIDGQQNRLLARLRFAPGA